MTLYKTSTNNFGTAAFIVDPTPGQGTHTTIAGALTDASSGQTIFIRPSTYTEDLTLKAGVNLAAYDCDAFTPNVTIVGKCTHNTAGTVSISGIRFQTNSDFCIVISGSNASNLYLADCWILANNTTAISMTSSSSFSFLECHRCIGTSSGASSKLFAVTGVNDIRFYFCRMGVSENNSTLDATSHHCGIVARETIFGMGITTSGSNGVDVTFTNCEFIAAQQALNITDTGASSHNAFTCSFNGGSASSINVGAGSDLTVLDSSFSTSNTNPISGSGTINISGLSLNSTAIMAPTTTSYFTSVGKAVIQNSIYVLAGSGSPSGSITAPKGSLYMRTDGSSTSTRAYINTNSGTTWTAITTVA